MKTTKTKTLFDQAADTFVNAFKTCVQVQEDTAKKCVELVKGWGESDDVTKQYQQFIDQTMPTMKKASEESMELWKKNAEKCMALLGEGFAATKEPSVEDAQARLKQLWEQSLGAMKENTETVVKLSGEAMQAYADYMKKLVPEPVPA